MLKEKSERKPGILVINWQDWTNPLSGGAEVHFYEIFKRLVDDFNIFLLCTHFKGAKSIEELEGIKIYRVGSRNTFNFWVPRAYKRIRKRERIDLVIEDLNKIPFYGKIFVSENRIAILHHLFGKKIYTETNPIFASYVFFAERLIPKFYDDIPIIAISESSKEVLVKMGIPEKNIEIVYNGIDLNRYFPQKKKTEEPTIVCLNRMKRYKRIDILLEAIPEVLRKISKLKVFIVGEGDDLPRLKKLAFKKRIEKVVNFTGFVPEGEKISLLSGSWVSVNTSPIEGWGLTSIEAQACGTLSVVPDSPGLRETVKDGFSGYIYRCEDAQALSEILVKLLKDKKFILKMGKQAREWASKYSWDNSKERMKKIIEANIKNNSR
ncbi:MAG: glycosyltransferase family 4 protein [candidate division WOR-3 bacterium]